MVNHMREPIFARWFACCSSVRWQQDGDKGPLTVQDFRGGSNRFPDQQMWSPTATYLIKTLDWMSFGSTRISQHKGGLGRNFSSAPRLKEVGRTRVRPTISHARDGSPTRGVLGLVREWDRWRELKGLLHP